MLRVFLLDLGIRTLIEGFGSFASIRRFLTIVLSQIILILKYYELSQIRIIITKVFPFHHYCGGAAVHSMDLAGIDSGETRGGVFTVEGGGYVETTEGRGVRS